MGNNPLVVSLVYPELAEGNHGPATLRQAFAQASRLRRQGERCVIQRSHKKA